MAALQVGPSAVNTVITVPPWARGEPPSPEETSSQHEDDRHLSAVRPSAAASYSSLESPSRWWAFTIPRSRSQNQNQPVEPPSLYGSAPQKSRKRTMSWLYSSHHRRPQETHDWNIQHHQSPVPPLTLAHTQSPGWDIPWTPRLNQDANKLEDPSFRNADVGAKGGTRGWWKKKLRAFVLTNNYVPLIFRFINLTFTSAALAIAVHIRLLEARIGITGAIGSSPTIVIIFAPLTLVYIMVAVYLTYSGRHLGPWCTSRKLALTLMEVFFICAWSGALSLCFDNFFTSLIPCASPKSIAWYNKIPRPSSSQFNNLDHSTSGKICNNQLALICLVGVGLVMCCTNLVTNLFRIFEKVKYHPAPALSRS